VRIRAAGAALVLALCSAAAAQVAIIQIQVVEGDGAVHSPGSRSPRSLTVEVTDETGRPVEGAAVSFHLPETGSSGVFANGLRTLVETTDARGRASARSLEVNRVAGRFEIRIVASREQARAGTVSPQYIAELAGGASKPAAAGTAASTRPHRRHGKWIAGAAVAGGTVAALLAARSGGGTAAQPGTPAPAAPPVMGTPVITVGKP
jgi:hypothetical protein